MQISVDYETNSICITGKVSKAEKSQIETYMLFPEEFNLNPITFRISKYYKNIFSFFFYNVSKAKMPLLKERFREPNPGNNLPIFYRAFKAHIKSALKKKPNKNDLEKLCNSIDEYLVMLREIKVEDKHRKLHRLADELCSYQVEQQFLKYCYKNNIEQLDEKIDLFIKKHKKYRFDNYGEPRNEAVSMRNKSRVLCRKIKINYSVKRLGVLLEQGVFAFSAFLSMFFTTILVFLVQDGYGTLSLNLFIALCISYIFKDRFKEIFRNYVLTRIRKNKDQFAVNLTDSNGVFIGQVTEMVNYAPVKEKYLATNKFKKFFKNIQDYSSLYYRKRYCMASKFRNDLNHIKDDTYINLKPFINNLYEQQLSYYKIAEDGSLERELQKAIYEVKLIIVKNSEQMKCYRIYINSDGVLDLTPVQE